MTVGLSNCWTSDLSFEISDLLIYVMTYRVGQKKVSQIIFAITLSSVIQFSQFLARIHYRKFATGGYIASPPNLVCVITLPCKILTTTFFTLIFTARQHSLLCRALY